MSAPVNAYVVPLPLWMTEQEPPPSQREKMKVSLNPDTPFQFASVPVRVCPSCVPLSG